MRIIELRTFEGRNIHSHYPVVEMLLDLGGLDGRQTKDLGDFSERLLVALPGLNQHHCSLGRPGGFIERVREGTYVGHVVEHVALELQTRAGLGMVYGKTRRTAQPGVYRIVFEYRAREAGMEAARQAVELTGRLVAGELPDVTAALAVITKTAALTELGPSTAAIAEAARRRGIPVTRIGPESLLQLGYGSRQKRVRATVTAGTSCIGVDIAGDKSLTKLVLARAGIPVPPGTVARTEEEAVEAARIIAEPVVVKPSDGNQGRGVSLNLSGDEQVRAAFGAARRHGQVVIVEKFVEGRHYRLLVVDGRLEAAAERLPASVTGDGEHTVAELIELANADPNRGEEHEKPLTKMKVDEVVHITLTKQGLGLDFRPAAGAVVRLREGANLSTGGTARDVTDEANPDIIALAVRAAAVIGLDVAGIDLVTPDIALPPDPGRTAIIEVNAAPGIRMHLYPSEGQPRPVAEAIVRSMFPAGEDGRIPVIAVTGTNGKTTVSRLIAHIFKEQGKKVGLTTTDGIWIDGRRVVDGDTSGPWSAKAILSDPKVEVAVLETARGGIIRGGLAFDHCDVAVVTNISSDHLGQDGIETIEDLVDVKALLVEAVPRNGFAILNADDSFVVELGNRTDGEIIYFSQQDDNLIVRRHLNRRGKAVIVRKGQFILAHGGNEVRLGNVRDFPLTVGGRAQHNIQNLLAAAAAGWATGADLGVLSQAFRAFSNSPECNPGRLNVHEVGDLRLVVDYGHNPAAFQNTLRVVRTLCSGRLLGVIAAPGDRRDEDLRELGRIAARGFSTVFIKEDHEKRGRRPGEVAELLLAGALDGGARRETVIVILDEEEAVLTACRGARGGDVVVVFYEKYDRIAEIARKAVTEWHERAVAPRTLAAAGAVTGQALAGGPGE
ncbi:MAG: cyanophycin synthetase [Bacillota bacterium]